MNKKAQVTIKVDQLDAQLIDDALRVYRKLLELGDATLDDCNIELFKGNTVTALNRIGNIRRYIGLAS